MHTMKTNVEGHWDMLCIVRFGNFLIWDSEEINQIPVIRSKRKLFVMTLIQQGELQK